MDEYMYWKGEPIIYSRESGTGLILGGYHYRFTQDGGLETLHRVTSPVLEMVLSKMYKHPAQAMAAHARRLSSMQQQQEVGNGK